MSFEAAGFRFRLDGAFSSEIFLDGAEDEVQDLVHKSRVFILPLFYTLEHLYGLILTKTRGIRAYRRLGTIEIRFRQPKSSDTSSRDAEPRREANNATQSPKHLEETATNVPEHLRVFDWHLNAAKLLLHFCDLQRSQIFIS
jgi:hypothetical protein